MAVTMQQLPQGLTFADYRGGNQFPKNCTP